MKKLLNIMIGLCTALVVLVAVKFALDACEPHMHKYFEVEK